MQNKNQTSLTHNSCQFDSGRTCDPHNKIEILSPAGSFESVVAAVQNNANAVYLGQKLFNARQNADNFDIDMLRETVEYCHVRGVKVYQTLNIIVFDNEINDLTECIKSACEVGVDALIVQDLGVLDLVKKTAPTMPIHISTQMSVHTKKGAQLAKSLGATRVVLARELSFNQIKEIVTNVDIETEVFVHGALCMSVSGQCYMSGMIGGRSGNRGSCAGTCRLPFSSTDKPSHDLSLKDLCLADYVLKLQEIGVTSLKIEGRMKRPEYVAIATKAYDDARLKNSPDIELLRAIFSRNGFTQGYFLDETGPDMFGTRQKDDVVSATPKLFKELQNTYKKETPLISLNFDVKIKKDNPIILSATDQDGNTAFVEGEPPQIAQNKPIDSNYVLKLISKLGSTPFFVDSFKSDIDDGLMVSASVLNALRRQACDEIINKRKQPTTKISFTGIDPIDAPLIKSSGKKLYLRFGSLSQISEQAINQCDKIILPLDTIESSSTLNLDKTKVIIELPRIMFSNEKLVIKKLSTLKEQGYTSVVANNLAHIQIANDLNLSIIGGAFLNISNSISMNSVQSLGVKEQIVSFETTVSNISRLKTTMPVGVISYGHMPLMATKNCPIKNQIDCKDCKKQQSLTDRMGIKFPVKCADGYSEIFNSKAIFMGDRLSEFGQISFEVLYFSIENSKQCNDIINLYKQNLKPTGDYTRGLYYRKV